MTLQNSAEFMQLTNWIRKKLPRSYFGGIIASYFINAVMIGFFLFPTLKVMIGYWAALLVASIGTVVIQYFRGLIVFTDLLFAESGENSKYLVKIVALVMTIVGVFELWHLLSGFKGEVSNGQLIGVFVFGSSIIVGGWMMEINFIKQTNQYVYKSAQLPKLGEINGNSVFRAPGFQEWMHNFFDSYKENSTTSITKDNPQKMEEQASNSYKETMDVKQEDNSQKKSGITEEDILDFTELESSNPLQVDLDANFSSNGHQT